MDWLKDQFSRSNIISGLLAVGIWGAVIALSLQQAPIPDILYAGGMSVIAFFFGTKVGERNGEEKILNTIEKWTGGSWHGKLQNHER